jgi:hypothetical protein
MRHDLTAEFVLQLSSMLNQFLLILDQLRGLVKRILKRSDPVTPERDPCSLMSDLTLELLLIFEKNCHELGKGGIEGV